MTELLDYHQLWRTSFATRLIQKLKEKGYISRRGSKQVNGKHLATAIGVSLAMVRRYINAQSIPSGMILKKIADWLDIDPVWLLYGNTHTTTPANLLDQAIFKEIFLQFYDILCRTSIAKTEYLKIIQGCIEIYHQVVNLDPEQPRDKAINLIVDFLRKQVLTQSI